MGQENDAALRYWMCSISVPHSGESWPRVPSQPASESTRASLAAVWVQVLGVEQRSTRIQPDSVLHPFSSPKRGKPLRFAQGALRRSLGARILVGIHQRASSDSQIELVFMRCCGAELQT